MPEMEFYMNNRYFKNCMGMIHYVKRGDTLYSISRIHGVSIDELIEANPFVNVYNMQEGDEICVPVSYNTERMNNRVNENEPQAKEGTNREDFYDLVKRFDK